MKLYQKSILIGIGIISILVTHSVVAQMPPALNIPPTNAFDKIRADNGSINSVNFSMPLIVKGGSGVQAQANNRTHTLTISTVVSPNTQGTYNTTQANNANINTKGYKINFINGSGSTVNVLNSKSGTQVNVTISATGTGGTITGTGLTPELAYWTTTSNIMHTTNLSWLNSNNTLKPTTNDAANLGTVANAFNNLWVSVITATQVVATAINTGDISAISGNHINIDTNVNFTAKSLYNMSNITVGAPTQSDAENFICGPGTVAKDCILNWIAWNTMPNIKLARSQGTYPANGQTPLGTNIGQLVGSGNTGSAFSGPMTRIQMMTAETTTSTNQGSDIMIQTVPLGSTAIATTLGVYSLTSNFTSNLAYLAGNFTSDANAISNMPIKNHYCATYFVTGNSTFRFICNFNGLAHPLAKG